MREEYLDVFYIMYTIKIKLNLYLYFVVNGYVLTWITNNFPIGKIQKEIDMLSSVSRLLHVSISFHLWDAINKAYMEAIMKPLVGSFLQVIGMVSLKQVLWAPRQKCHLQSMVAQFLL